MKDEQSSSKTSLQALEGKYKKLEQSLTTEKNERPVATTRAEAVERGLSQVEKKYQSAKASQKTKEKEMKQLQGAIQELSAEMDELKKEGNDNVNDPAISPFKEEPSAGVQHEDEVAEKVLETIEVEKVTAYLNLDGGLPLGLICTKVVFSE
ncbi:hypothetical protein FNV43_RR00532 [Rhamnella rubrinervis]|uniref:Uncharacterized protein n=1 Tax=Rhamnella rubrinervis TaxID=2594499 RepID=A0A8K0HNV1_9ROSA|nr:hypothetical protein FNV43_RR00532 [Rhamnella rubrinervis]